jgi:phage-related minor tail protein
MPTSIGTLLAKLQLDKSGFSAGMAAAKQEAQAFAASMKSVGDSVSSFGKNLTGLATPLIALGAAAMAASSDVNAGMRQIRVATGETGAALDGLKASFATVFSTVPASARDAGLAIAELHQLTSATGKTLEDLATQQLNLARITGSELKPQIEATTKAFNNYGISAQAQGASLDFLFKVSQQTGVSVTELATQIATSGGAARAAGLSFETSAALVGQLSKYGLDASSVMGGLTIAMRKIAQKGGDADPAAVLSAMVASIKEAGTQSKVNALAVEYFGRSGIAMGAAIKSGKLDVDALLSTLRNSKDTINTAAADTRTFGESMQVLKNQVELALAPLGREMTKVMKDLSPLIQDVVGWITNLARWFSELDPGTRKAVAGFVLLVGVMGPFLIVAGKMVTAIGSVYNGLVGFVGYVPKVVASLQAMNIATAASTLGWLALAAGVMYALYKIGEGHESRKLGPITGPVVAETGVGGAVTQGIQSRALDYIMDTQAAHQAGKYVGVAASDGVAEGVKSQVEQTKKAFDDATKKALANMGGHGKKAGADTAKALVDEFKNGLPGLTAAIAKVDSSNLSGLFDKMGKAARAGAALTVDALKVTAAAISEFAQSMGVAGKINEAQLADMDKPVRLALERETLAYAVAKDQINRIQVEDLANRKTIFEVTQADLDKFTESAKKKFTDLGGVFRILPPDLAKMGLTITQVTGDASGDIAKFASDSQTSFNAFIAKLQQVATEAPKPFSALTIAAQSAAQKLKESLAGDETLALLRAQDDIRNSLKGTVDQLYGYGEAAGKTGAALDRFVTDALSQMHIFTADQQVEVGKVIEAHKKAAIQLPGIWNDVFSKMSSGARSGIAAIFGVLDTIPGKFGDVVRKAQSTISQWVSFFNSILGLLSKFSNSIPSSIGDAISKVIGIFKSAQSGIADTGHSIGGTLASVGSSAAGSSSKISNAVGKMSNTTKEAFAGMAGAAASFAAALAVTSATGSKSMGVISSLFTSTLAGIQAGLAFGPIGGAIVGGVSLIGGIIGALFGGKSAAQKEQERLQNDKLKADIAASAQATMNAAIEGFQKALAFLDTLDQFTAPRKAKFQEFWKAMSRLMDGFVVLAKKFQNENLTKLKDVADSISSIAQGIAATPAAFDAINLSFTIPDTQFDIFFNNLDRFMNAFFVRSEVWVVGVSKRAKKVADRLASVVDLIAPFTEGIKGLFDLKVVPDDALNVFDQMLERMVQHIGALADKFDKGWLKTLAFFAEKAQAATDLIKGAVDAIKAVADVQPVSEGAVNAVVDGISMFVTKLIAAADSMTSEALGKAAAIAQAVIPISAALKAWVEAAGLAKGYTQVAAATWEAIKHDFDMAIGLMLQMLDQAIRFIPDSVHFADVMKTISDNMKAGLDSMASGLAAAESAFNGLLNIASGGPQQPISGGGGLGGAAGSSFAASSFGGFAPAYAGNSSAGNEVYNFHFYAPVNDQGEFEDRIVKVMTRIKRKGRD